MAVYVALYGVSFSVDDKGIADLLLYTGMTLDPLVAERASR
jgi:hypothetical protein